MQKFDVKTWLKFAGTLLLVLAGIFCCLLAVMQIEELNHWYVTWQSELVHLEERVEAVGNSGLIVLLVLLLFTLKSVFPLITIPAISVIAGAVLPWYFALLVNIIGIAWLMTIRYWQGRVFGGGNTIKLVRQNEIVRDLFESKGTGNPYMLFVFRLIPSFPVNSISRLYGAMLFRYRDYILISMAGFLYKIISYTVLGRNVYNPLSASFLVPLILLCSVSGCLLLGLHYILLNIEKNQNSEKER